MKEYNVGILGATGAVGREFVKVLEQRNFPVKSIRLLASSRSAGKTMKFKGQDVVIKEAKEGAFDGLDIVFGAAENDVSIAMTPYIKASGAVYIDNSSAYRLDPDVPLVIPEVNKEDIKNHKGIIANPNCVTIVALTALAPILKLTGIKTIVASSYQAVSGAGAAGLTELEDQTVAYAKGEEIKVNKFAHQILNNVIPKIGGMKDNGYSSEEMKLQNEGRKITHLPDMKVCCTCVRIPVQRSHSVSVQFVTEKHISVEEAKKAVMAGENVKLVDDPANEVYPMPLETSDQDLVYVGRIREDLINENGLALWCCGDQIRKGAATNAIQIAECL